MTAATMGCIMSVNLPILYRNIFDGLPSDLARDAFLWATDRPDNDRMCYVAEAYAREVDKLQSDLSPMLDASRGAPHDPSLMAFILKRHANWRFGGNVAPDFLEEHQ